MKLLKKIVLVLLLLVLAFIANIFISTGYFRTIEPKFEGTILHKIALQGAEDITISVKDSFAIISATARKSVPKTEEEYGGLYYLNLKDTNYTPLHLTSGFKKSFAPHGISMFAVDSSYTIMAVNHTPTGHTIEVFKLTKQQLVHQKTITHPSLVSPNDIVLIDQNRFYVTNDHKYVKGLGRLAEDYGGFSFSTILYFDGDNFTEVAKGIGYANGINFDAKRNLVFVASPRKFLVKVYSRNKDGSLHFIENIDCNTGVDNIEFDTEGALWIGAHPNLLRFASYAKGNNKTTPSEIIKINYKAKGDYSIEQIYMEDGSTMSGSTVAAPFGDLILTGNVMATTFLILQRSSN